MGEGLYCIYGLYLCRDAFKKIIRINKFFVRLLAKTLINTIWNGLCISEPGGLIHGWGLVFGEGAYSREFTVIQNYRTKFDSAEHNSGVQISNCIQLVV